MKITYLFETLTFKQFIRYSVIGPDNTFKLLAHFDDEDTSISRFSPGKRGFNIPIDCHN